MNEPLIGTSEVAKILKVCDRTVRTTVRERGLIPIQIGNKLRYRPSDVERWQEDQIQLEYQRAASMDKVIDLMSARDTHGVA